MTTAQQYQIVKNSNASTHMDQAVINAEGVYRSLDEAMDAMPAGLVPAEDWTPDGDSLWYYLEGTTEEEMEADLDGYDMVAKIVALRD